VIYSTNQLATSAPDAVTPLRYMLPGVSVRMAKVTHVDLDACEIRFLQGTGRFPQTLEYDHLVLRLLLAAQHCANRE